jgi:hypothetical protein
MLKVNFISHLSRTLSFQPSKLSPSFKSGSIEKSRSRFAMKAIDSVSANFLPMQLRGPIEKAVYASSEVALYHREGL